MNNLFPTTSNWNFFQKYFFRFTLLYFLLYTLPFPFDSFPGTGEWLYEATENMWDKVVPWFGEDVVGVDYEIKLACVNSL